MPFPVCRSAPAAGPSLAATARRQKEDLAAAIHQLTRSIGALLADQLLHFSTRLPQEWSPFAALAGTCNLSISSREQVGVS